MRVDATRLVRFGATHVHSFRRTARDVQVHIGISLLGGRLAAVAFDIGHGPADDIVVLLHRFYEILQSLMIRGAILLVDLVRDRIQRIECVHANATLEAGTGQLSQSSLHLVLQNDILDARSNMQETVNALAGKRRQGSRQIRALLRQIVSLRHGIDRRSDHGMVNRFGDQFAKQVDFQITPS